MTLMFTWKLRDMNNKFATESRLGNIESLGWETLCLKLHGFIMALLFPWEMGGMLKYFIGYTCKSILI